jgi:quinol monooxygenase YgiN
MEAIGLLVTLEARPGKEADAEGFLKSAQPLALNEKGTLKWYAIKLGPGKFGIFDTFANEGGRNAHLTGEIAKALGARANELFAAPPEIEKMEVLASTPLKQLESVGNNSITIQNKSGVFHINITQPLTTGRRRCSRRGSACGGADGLREDRSTSGRHADDEYDSGDRRATVR